MIISPQRVLAVTTAGFLLASTTTACSSEQGTTFSELSIQKIEKEVRQDMGGLGSVEFTGSLTRDGATSELSLQADKTGGCRGTIRTQGVTAEIIRTHDGSNFIKGDAAFWRATSGAQAKKLVRLVGEKWAKISSGDQFAEFCDLDNLLEELNQNNDDEKSSATKGEEAEFGGESVIEIRNEADGSTTTALVLVEDPHFIVKLTSTGREDGQFEFSEFDVPFEVEAPDDYVDLG
jgi:hypothetical protein